MLNPEDIRWVKSTANELNNLLQVISESSQSLIKDVVGPEKEKYKEILNHGLTRASMVTKSMLEKVGASESGGLQNIVSLPPEKTEMELQSPVVKESVTQIPPQEHEVPGASHNESILIVDDEEFVLLLAKRILADAGYKVITAKDGFECLNLYRKMGREISLIILDFTMPIMDGAELFQELKLINPRVAVVLSSGFTENERLRSMLAHGLRGFIPKPYSREKLLLQIRTTLDAIREEKAG